MAKYFDNDEITCNCGCERGLEEISPILLERLDRLRELWGKPIYVSCMYRCPQHNRDVGGVENSQHVYGKAADIFVNSDYHAFYNFIINSELFDGVGYYPDEEFVHVDVRDDGLNGNGYRW